MNTIGCIPVTTVTCAIYDTAWACWVCDTGTQHVPRAEDVPNTPMNTAIASFFLEPFNYFDEHEIRSGSHCCANMDPFPIWFKNGCTSHLLDLAMAGSLSNLSSMVQE